MTCVGETVKDVFLRTLPTKNKNVLVRFKNVVVHFDLDWYIRLPTFWNINRYTSNMFADVCVIFWQHIHRWRENASPRDSDAYVKMHAQCCVCVVWNVGGIFFADYAMAELCLYVRSIAILNIFYRGGIIVVALRAVFLHIWCLRTKAAWAL